MSYFLGLDLGTSVLKATIINEKGSIIANSAKELQISAPKPDYAEASPEEWWKTFTSLIKTVSIQVDISKIAAVGLSGQMHGLICYDKELKSIRPAIIWADQRSTLEVEYALSKIGSEKLYSITGNPIFTGFQLASLLWIKNNEPENFKKIYKVSTPKDYITLQLTGELFCEPSDALATGCFDYNKNNWSTEILQATNLNPNLFPKIIPTQQKYGTVTQQSSALTGLPAGIPVFGGSDQSMAAMGTGLIKNGESLLAVSTGGQFLVISKKGTLDPARRLHTLNHAITNKTIHMAATLSAGLSMKWFKTKILTELDTGYDAFIKDVEDIPTGANGLIYLPFLTGERTPFFNPNLRGAFIGQTFSHNRIHMIRAVMEGVAFSFLAGLKTFKDNNLKVNEIILSGGGTKNATWRQIITDVLGIPTKMINIDDHSPFGAAVFAMFASQNQLNPENSAVLKEFYQKAITTTRRLKPNQKNHATYQNIYQQYKSHADYLNFFYKN